MAGVKRFDEAAALDRIMQVFWQRGYEGASIEALVAATGLKRGSLYNAFGDKEAMFRLALARYAATVAPPMLAALEGDEPVGALTAMFEAQITGMARPTCPGGCLVVVAATEAGQRSDAISRLARERLAALETAIYEMLLRAQTGGRLAPGVDLRALARFFTAASLSLTPIHRSFGDLAYARDVVRTALSVLAGPAVRPGG